MGSLQYAIGESRCKPKAIHLPQVLIDEAVGHVISERQHAAAGVLDQHDLLGPKQLLRNDDAA